MLPVCPILVFQLNWKHLSIMGAFDGTGVKLAGRETIPCQRIWGTGRISQAVWALHTKPEEGKGVGAEHPQGVG